MTEQEKRLHRCCFSGHRPEKLSMSEREVKAWLDREIDRAVRDGYTTFMTGMAMGVDIRAGQLVLAKKRTNPSLHLIAVTPWPGFPLRWKDDWRAAYRQVWENADLRVVISDEYYDDVFRKRNEWMVDHSSRLIACYNGAAGGTRNMIAYAESRGIEIIVSKSAD